MTAYPKKLTEILELFEGLSETDRREMLTTFAEEATRHEPKPGERFDIEDVRKDPVCIDKVGVFLSVDPEGRARFKVLLGFKVQTLTRALTTILCRGLEDSRLDTVQGLSGEFIPQIVGADLIRLRSRTVYYLLKRFQAACATYLQRETERGPSSG